MSIQRDRNPGSYDGTSFISAVFNAITSANAIFFAVYANAILIYQELVSGREYY